MTRGSSATRIVGVDVARCVALLGMMATHVVDLYLSDTDEVSVVHDIASGRASALFAVLAGVSLALTTGRGTPLRGRALGGAAAGIAVRAVLVTALGLVLGALESGVLVILAYYGVLFLLAVPFLGLRAQTLFALAVPWLVLSPVVSHLLRGQLPEVPLITNPEVGSLQEPGRLLRELALTGTYPAFTWLGYALLGLAIGRCDLRRWWSAGALVVLGAGAALVAVAASGLLLRTTGAREAFAPRLGPRGYDDPFFHLGFRGVTPTDSWWWLAVAEPHSGTPFDLVQTAGSACVVLGVGLVVGRLVPGVARVVFGAGAMTLSLYTLHLLLMHWFPDARGVEPYLRQVAVVVVVGAVFALLRRRGPLEWGVGTVSDGVRRAVAGRRAADVPVGGRV